MITPEPQLCNSKIVEIEWNGEIRRIEIERKHMNFDFLDEVKDADLFESEDPLARIETRLDRQGEDIADIKAMLQAPTRRQ